MTEEFISFESVEWNHLEYSEEIYKRKHQNRLLEFKRGIQSLKEDFRSFLRFTSITSENKIKDEEQIVNNNTKSLVESKTENESLKQKIKNISYKNDCLRESIEQSNKELKALEQEVTRLLKRKSDFAGEVKSTYNAFIMAKDYYKDKLKMYFTIEGPPDGEEINVLVEFFTSKKRKESKYSVTILRSKNGTCTLLDMKPKLSVFHKMEKRLRETGDIPGLLCCARKCFLKHIANRNVLTM